MKHRPAAVDAAGPATPDPAAACPVCGGHDSALWARAHDREYFTTAESFDYRRCDDCAAVFIEPQPVDRLAEIYPANYYSYAPGRRSLALRVKERLDAANFRRILARLKAGRLNVLDVGGGEGTHLTMIRGLDPRVAVTQVVDLDEQAGRLAVAEGHRFFHGRIEDFAPDERFDLILLVNLIEHVSEPGKVLAALRECLNPGGLILVKTPNVDSLDARVFRHRNWGGLHCPRHWILFNQANFTHLAETAGLVVARFAYTQGAPFWATSVLAWLHRRGLVRLSAERPAVRHPFYRYSTPVFAAFDFARLRLGAAASQMYFELARDTAEQAIFE